VTGPEEDVAPRAQALLDNLAELGGAGAVVVELGPDRPSIDDPAPGVVRIGVCQSRRLPTEGLDAFDILLTDDAKAARPWVGQGDRLEATIQHLQAQVARQPVATAVCAQVLRLGERLSFEEALISESIAYSMLLGSAAFTRWRSEAPARQRSPSSAARVLIGQAGDTLEVRLNRPQARNAFDARMRDDLVEALDFALAHPDAPPVLLTGEGPAFSAGGDLDEFGQAEDIGAAHLVRSLRSPTRLIHRLGRRLTVRIHGACVGAGIEAAAAAARLVAQPGAFFRLPEVSMGLIPGAGGTASIPRRIGRHRAAFMAISGADIDLATALAWGLVDASEPAA
jgi:enoyl-CoA hydratase/carnithine racemase